MDWSEVFDDHASYQVQPDISNNKIPAVFDRSTQDPSILDESMDVDIEPLSRNLDPKTGSIHDTETPELYSEDDFKGDTDTQSVSEDPFTASYNLRVTTKDPHRIFASDRVDHDDTGDYDPVIEARKIRVRKRQPRPTHRRSTAAENGILDCIGTRGDPDIANPERRVCKIVFKSEEGKREFSEFCSHPPAREQIELARDAFSEGYRLRKRKATRPTALSGLGRDQAVSPGLPDDQCGHPAARGCWACQRLGLLCSLLENEFSWPCSECKLAGEECQLIQEPVRKMSCRHCINLQRRNKWLICSFEYGDTMGACKRCVKDGQLDCIAGPDPRSIHVRIRLHDNGEPYANARPRYRPAHDQSCRACQDAERICSFACGEVDGTCVACDMSGTKCTPIISAQPQKASSRKRPSKSKSKKLEEEPPAILEHVPVEQGLEDLQAHSRVDTELISHLSQTSGKRGETTAIVKGMRTSFHHPIIFNVDKQTNEDCDFCANPAFSMIGSEEREIQIIELEGGRGWQEVGGTQEINGTVATSVCAECTTSRMEVVMCDEHTMRLIPGLSIEAMDCGAALDRLMLGDIVSADKWCALCCSLAFYECCHTQQSGEDGMPEGCGLALCEQCESDLRKCGGDLQVLLEGLIAGTTDRCASLRADYGLLKADGLLMQFVLHDVPNELHKRSMLSGQAV